MRELRAGAERRLTEHGLVALVETDPRLVVSATARDLQEDIDRRGVAPELDLELQQKRPLAPCILRRWIPPTAVAVPAVISEGKL